MPIDQAWCNPQTISRRIKFLSGLVIALLLCSACRVEQPSLELAPADAVVNSLPTPSAVLRDCSTVSPGRVKTGVDFSLAPGHFNRVEAASESRVAAFGSNYPADGSVPDGLAYCFYTFDLPEYTDTPMLHLEWFSLDIPWTAWVGIGDPQRDRWQWLPYWQTDYCSGAMDFRLASIKPYLTEQDRLAVAVVITGTQRGVLRWVRVGANYPPTAHALALPSDGAAPLVVSFDPDASHDNYGGAIARYEWDFEGDGNYDETTQYSYTFPVHTYTEPGLYRAGLRVTDNEGGQAVYEMTINVRES